jgi:hypothetical protein
VEGGRLCTAENCSATRVCHHCAVCAVRAKPAASRHNGVLPEIFLATHRESGLVKVIQTNVPVKVDIAIKGTSVVQGRLCALVPEWVDFDSPGVGGS